MRTIWTSARLVYLYREISASWKRAFLLITAALIVYVFLVVSLVSSPGSGLRHWVYRRLLNVPDHGVHPTVTSATQPPPPPRMNDVVPDELSAAEITRNDTLHCTDRRIGIPLGRVDFDDLLVDSFAWKRVSGRFHETYVFSAYYDDRLGSARLVIVGISDEYTLRESLSQGREFCLVWYPDEREKFDVVEAEFSYVPEHHDLRFAASLHICPLRRGGGSVPLAVSLIVDRCLQTKNVLRVENHSQQKTPSVDFTICVSPLINSYSNYQQLVETVELNRIFGADEFIFYNYSTGAIVHPFLENYLEEGVARMIIPWTMPQVDIHYFGQVAALNDCLYRNMFRSKFIVFVDLDELIVPRQHMTWNEMLDAVAEKIGTRKENDVYSPATYIFRNTFFPKDWGNKSRHVTIAPLARRLGLNSLLLNVREDRIYEANIRSKYMVRPALLEMVGIHFPFRSLPAVYSPTVHVEPSYGLVHHYRDESVVEDDVEVVPVYDPSIYRFQSLIVERTRDRYLRLSQGSSKDRGGKTFVKPRAV